MNKIIKVILILLICFGIFLFLTRDVSSWNFDTGGTSEVIISTSTTTYSGNLTNLSEMQDTNIPAPTDNNVLSYDSATGMWIDVAPSAVGDTNCSVDGSCGLITYDSELSYYTDSDIDGTETAFNGWDKDSSNDFIDIANFTGDLTDTKYCTYDSSQGIINCTAEGGSGITWAQVINGTVYLSSNPYSFYNSTDFDINDYINSTYTLGNITNANTTLYNWVVAQGYSSDAISLATLLGFSYYNSTDFSISNYFTKTEVLGFSYYNATDFSIADYSTTTQMNTEIESANTTLYNWIVAQSYGEGGGITWAMAINGTLLTTELYNINYSTNDEAYRSITNTSYYLATNPDNFISNDTMNKSVSCSSIEGAVSDLCTLISSSSEVDPYWTSNFTSYNTSWTSTINDSYQLKTNYTDWNESGWIVNWSQLIDGVSLSTLLSFSYWNDSTTSFTSTGFNSSVGNLLITTYYNATQSEVVVGTVDGGSLEDTMHNDGSYDGITFNLSEESGAPGLDLRINFTGLEDFNMEVIRYKTSTLSGDYPIIQMWNYDYSIWEDYPPLGESVSFATITQPVFDSSDHILGGLVQMRIYKVTNGNTNNHYYVDWIAIADGLGVPSGQEVDPYSYHLNENINATGYNGTFDYLFGDGSQLTNLPAGTEVDPYWTSNFTSYNTSWTSTINDSYQLKTNYTDWNSTGLIINWSGDYLDLSTLLSFSYYNSTDFSISNYFTKTEVLGFSYWNNTNYGGIGNWSADKNDYATVDEPLWNDNFTKYNSSWTSTINNSYQLKTNYTDWNETGLIINWSGNYLDLSTLLGFNYYNSTDFSISNYFTKTEVLGFSYYNSTDFNINDYLTEVDWNTNYSANNDLWLADTDSNLTEDDVESYIFDLDNNVNLPMEGYNVTNVSYTTFCNGVDCWKMYVNASNYFIIEET